MCGETRKGETRRFDSAKVVAMYRQSEATEKGNVTFKPQSERRVSISLARFAAHQVFVYRAVGARTKHQAQGTAP